MATESNGNSLKGIGVVLMIIALITGVASIITPMNNQLHTIQKNIDANEQRNEKNRKLLDDKFQIEINNIKDLNREYHDILREHIQKHEGNNARMDERIIHLMEHIDRLERQYEKLRDQYQYGERGY